MQLGRLRDPAEGEAGLARQHSTDTLLATRLVNLSSPGVLMLKKGYGRRSLESRPFLEPAPVLKGTVKDKTVAFTRMLISQATRIVMLLTVVGQVSRYVASFTSYEGWPSKQICRVFI